VDTFARRDDLVVFIGNNDPALLFCMDRKGWLIGEEQSEDAQVRAIWRSGAKIAVVPGAPVGDEVWEFLNTVGSPVFTSGRIRVYRLP
jgi:hypothetical protein